jgi:hypothetical protein
MDKRQINHTIKRLAARWKMRTEEWQAVIVRKEEK